MYLSYVTYFIVVALLIFGGKIAKGRGVIHQNSTSLEVTKSLRGLCAIGVILHHISQQTVFQNANGWGKPGELFIFVNAGFYFVAIFFFFSGYGLLKSLDTKENYLQGFLKKRVLKTLVIPFYINIVLYGIFRLCIHEKLSPINWVFNFIGFTMMNEYAWYPIVLAILYLAFYFIFKNIKNRKVCFALMLAIILLQGIFFCFNGHFAWWAGPKNWWLNETSKLHSKWWTAEKLFWFSGEWWVNSSIAFFIGMLFANNEEKIRNWFSKIYFGKFLLIIILYIAFSLLASYSQYRFGYWSEYSGNGAGILNKFICYVTQLPQVTIFVILVFAIMIKYYVQNPVLNFFGNISLETYMMNLMALNIAERFILAPSVNKLPHFVVAHRLVIDEVAVIALTIILGLIYKKICSLVNRK